jgi:carbamoyltransferase
VKVLGIANAWDSGAALLVDGVVVAAANEERFSRIKLDRCFPERAIDYVLAAGGLDLDGIDLVASGCWKGAHPSETMPRLLEEAERQVAESSDPERTEKMVSQRLAVSKSRDAEFRDELVGELAARGVGTDRIRFFDHHYTHAVSAWSPSGFDEALVLTADGRGDGRAVTLWHGTRTGLKLLDMATELVSPGALYGFITAWMGFVPDRHEGKVTGLAAYGVPSEARGLLEAGYGFDVESGRLRSAIGPSYAPFVTARLPELEAGLEGHRREDVAHAVQTLLEDSLIGFLEANIERLGIESTNLCLAGGCMGNVRLNQKLREVDEVDGVYVFPHMGDGGLGLGAAMAVELEGSEETGGRRVAMETAYMGPGFSDEAIEAVVVESGLPYRLLDEAEVAPVVADLIAKGTIVGWFQQRMEVGPRALGARSILASATDQGINDSLNRRLDRTEFMPFAPATTEALAGECFVGWEPQHAASRFMTMCYDCTQLLAERCPAVVHVDGTARPQVVVRNHNPRYHDVIQAYASSTGNPAIINTSFNHHEEPIVLSPQDALRSLVDGNVDVLVAGRCLVSPAE